MRVAICDDCIIDREIIQEMIRRFSEEASVRMEVRKYESGASLLYEVEDGTGFDVIFLDIYLGDMMGIDVARRLRELRYTRSIVFLTASPHFAVAGYDVAADGYLLKPHDYEKMRRVLSRVIQSADVCVYEVRRRTAITYVPLTEILYVESRNARCLLHRSNGDVHTIYKKLDIIEQELNDQRFLRSHKSYLVNMDFIRQADKQFVLTTGDTVSIRQSELKRIRNEYLRYMSRRGEMALPRKTG